MVKRGEKMARNKTKSQWRENAYCGRMGFIYLWHGGLSGWRGSPRRVGFLVRCSDLSESLVAAIAAIAASLDWGMHERPFLPLFIVRTSLLMLESCGAVGRPYASWWEAYGEVGRVVCRAIVRSWSLRSKQISPSAWYFDHDGQIKNKELE